MPGGTSFEKQLLYQDEVGNGEFREVNLIANSDGLALYETTWGPDSEAIFGDSPHTQKLVLKNVDLELCREFADTNLVAQLTEMFHSGHLEWLSDVQDILDKNAIPYVYMAFSHDGALYRPFCNV